MGTIGGLTAIEINPNDPNYCLECQYIGKIEALDSGVAYILAEVEHLNEFLNLQITRPLPCYLGPHETKKYQVYNPDADLMDITV